MSTVELYEARDRKTLATTRQQLERLRQENLEILREFEESRARESALTDENAHLRDQNILALKELDELREESLLEIDSLNSEYAELGERHRVTEQGLQAQLRAAEEERRALGEKLGGELAAQQRRAAVDLAAARGELDLERSHGACVCLLCVLCCVCAGVVSRSSARSACCACARHR